MALPPSWPGYHASTTAGTLSSHWPPWTTGLPLIRTTIVLLLAFATASISSACAPGASPGSSDPRPRPPRPWRTRRTRWPRHTWRPASAAACMAVDRRHPPEVDHGAAVALVVFDPDVVGAVALQDDVAGTRHRPVVHPVVDHQLVVRCTGASRRRSGLPACRSRSPAGTSLPVHRTAKSFVGIPGAGPPSPQSKSHLPIHARHDRSCPSGPAC